MVINFKKNYMAKGKDAHKEKKKAKKVKAK